MNTPHCDSELIPVVVQPRLDTRDILAVALSIVLPGVGHMIMGQTAKGLVILAAVLLSCGVGFLASFLLALDVYLIALASKDRQIAGWEFFPDYKKHLNL